MSGRPHREWLRGAHRYAGAQQDDIVVSSTSWEHHLSHHRDVLERHKNAGLTANVSKCVLQPMGSKFWDTCRQWPYMPGLRKGQGHRKLKTTQRQNSVTHILGNGEFRFPIHQKLR